jgi:hypothetical protein
LERLTSYVFQVIEYDSGPIYFTQNGQANPRLAQTNIFTEQTGISLLNVSYGSVAWGDYNNDGYKDLLVSGSGTGAVTGAFTKIYRNNGNNTFSEQNNISLPGVMYSSAAWGDYDNDGYLDILLTGNNTGTESISKIFRNNGGIDFSELLNVHLTGVRESSVAWCDFDNDGKLDIILTGISASGETTKIYHNDGNNTFTEQQGINLARVTNGSVSCADFDNDGYTDILLTGLGMAKVYRNNGNPLSMGFTELKGIALTGVSKSSVAWGDYDNNGYLDILLTGYDVAKEIPVSAIFKNNGDNTFTEQTGINLSGIAGSAVTTTTGASTAAWGDYNNDGSLDILLTGETSNGRICRIYTNYGNNTFKEQLNFNLPGVRFSSAAWGDYDNDGDLDIIITGEKGSSRITRIFRNEMLTANKLPEAPTG